MTLYRKYRAKDFKSVFGQDNIVKVLRQSVIENKFAHAYLFSGPRGTGKTSMARILAKSLNCLNLKNGEPCNKCANCIAINSGSFIDLIEIDAASNRGIDEIRDLKEGINFLPAEGTYKVYIIDEVHMLTEPAFNALLKTLEEPPSNVVFILATTEPQKLPLTIISRTQRFNFRLADNKSLEKKIQYILKNENIAMEDDAVQLIIKAGQGSFRDAETVLDKILSMSTSESKISKSEVEDILGYVSSETVKEFIDFLLQNNRLNALDLLHKLYGDGVNLNQFLKECLEYCRNLMIKSINKSDINLKAILRIINSLHEANLKIKHSLIGILPVELAVIDLTTNEGEISVEKKSKPVALNYTNSVALQKKKIEKKKEIPIRKIKNKDNVDKKFTDCEKKISKEECLAFIKKLNANKGKIIAAIKNDNQFLAVVLSAANFDLASQGDKLVLKVPSEFHKQQMEKNNNRSSLNKIIATEIGTVVPFDCIIDKINTTKSSKKTDNALLVEDILS